jgi:hypothetical protein
MSIEFLLTTLIIVASPGTGAVYTIGAGLTRGARASIWAAFACTLGIVPHLIAALSGLAALLHTSALLFDIVKYAGVAYLLYMAWATLKERGAMKIDAKADARSAWQIIVDGILLNLLNPKLSIFFVAFSSFRRPSRMRCCACWNCRAYSWRRPSSSSRSTACSRHRCATRFWAARRPWTGCVGRLRRHSWRWGRGWRCRRSSAAELTCARTVVSFTTL